MSVVWPWPCVSGRSWNMWESRVRRTTLVCWIRWTVSTRRTKSYSGSKAIAKWVWRIGRSLLWLLLQFCVGKTHVRHSLANSAKSLASMFWTCLQIASSRRSNWIVVEDLNHSVCTLDLPTVGVFCTFASASVGFRGDFYWDDDFSLATYSARNHSSFRCFLPLFADPLHQQPQFRGAALFRDHILSPMWGHTVGCGQPGIPM